MTRVCKHFFFGVLSLPLLNSLGLYMNHTILVKIFHAGGWTSLETRLICMVLNTRVFQLVLAISADFGAFQL